MLVTLNELICEFKYLKKSTIYKLTSKREIPHRKVHRRLLLFETEEVAQYLNSKKVITNDQLRTHILKKK